MNILDEIAARTKERIAEEKREKPLEVIRREAEMAQSMGQVRVDDARSYIPYAFEHTLAAPGMSYICEVKKASPSKGLIAPDFPYVKIAREYEEAGASAISCLTEPYYFLGRDEYLKEIVHAVQIPVLRKDFTVDEYMVYQARALGANAVLLICTILDDPPLKAYMQLAKELGMSALVETHTEEEVARALKADAKIIGVNNRDLKTFEVDLDTSARYRQLVPPGILFVSESGIKTAADVRKLEKNGTNAVLIGETLMRAENKRAELDRLKGQGHG